MRRATYLTLDRDRVDTKPSTFRSRPEHPYNIRYLHYGCVFLFDKICNVFCHFGNFLIILLSKNWGALIFSDFF